MKNYVQAGNSVTIPAPAPVLSGDGVLMGSLFGVAATSADTGEDVAISTNGVYELPKEDTTDTFDIGDPVEWDTANKRITALNSGVQIGIAIKDAIATATTATIKLTV